MEVFVIANKDKDLFINEQIRAKEVMVIGPNGEQLGIKNIKDALKHGKEMNGVELLEKQNISIK